MGNPDPDLHRPFSSSGDFHDDNDEFDYPPPTDSSLRFWLASDGLALVSQITSKPAEGEPDSVPVVLKTAMLRAKRLEGFVSVALYAKPGKPPGARDAFFVAVRRFSPTASFAVPYEHRHFASEVRAGIYFNRAAGREARAL